MSTVVLYCWCHSDGASVLLYFTFIGPSTRLEQVGLITLLFRFFCGCRGSCLKNESELFPFLSVHAPLPMLIKFLNIKVLNLSIYVHVTASLNVQDFLRNISHFHVTKPDDVIRP